MATVVPASNLFSISSPNPQPAVPTISPSQDAQVPSPISSPDDPGSSRSRWWKNRPTADEPEYTTSNALPFTTVTQTAIITETGTSNNSANPQSANVATMVCAVIGGIVSLAIVAAVVCFVVRRRRRDQGLLQNVEERTDEDISGVISPFQDEAVGFRHQGYWPSRAQTNSPQLQRLVTVPRPMSYRRQSSDYYSPPNSAVSVSRQPTLDGARSTTDGTHWGSRETSSEVSYFPIQDPHFIPPALPSINLRSQSQGKHRSMRAETLSAASISRMGSRLSHHPDPIVHRDAGSVSHAHEEEEELVEEIPPTYDSLPRQSRRTSLRPSSARSASKR